MKLVEIYVNDREVAGEYIGQAFFEWKGQEWEMTVRASSKEKAEALATPQMLRLMVACRNSWELLKIEI